MTSLNPDTMTDPAAPAAPADIAARLDRLPVTALHLLVLGVCALGFVFDLMEVAFGSVLSAVFSTPPNAVPPQQLAVLLASMYLGAVVGSPLLGWVADRQGRRRTLVGLMLWLGASSVAAAFSTGLDALTVCRALSGLALGAYPPLMISYLTDLLPPTRRGMLFMLMASVAALGPPLGIFGVRALAHSQPLGMDPWRWGLAVGAAGATVVGLLFFVLPESPRWLKAKGRIAEAERACSAFERSRVLLAAGAEVPKRSEADAPSRRPWPRVATLFLLSPWATVAFPLLSGAVLAQKGFGLSDTLFYVGISTFGPLVGSALAALGLDRLDRRWLLMVCAAGMIVGGGLFVQTSQPGLLVLANVVFGIAGAVYISAMTLYGSELFPTPRRAASLAGAWSLNRVGAVAAPFLLLPLLKLSGPGAMFAVIAATLAASIALLALSPQGRQGQSVN
ncbi:MAG TPA: MFS transporter [Burkholderiaceae bacterium]|jgi:putative MFS transporter